MGRGVEFCLIHYKKGVHPSDEKGKKGKKLGRSQTLFAQDRFFRCSGRQGKKKKGCRKGRREVS